MNRLSKLLLTGLAALVSLTVLLPAPYALAQGPDGEQNTVSGGTIELPPVPELYDGKGNDPSLETPALEISSQGGLESDQAIEPAIPELIHQPDGNDPYAGEMPEAPPADVGNHPVAGAPVPDTRPARQDNLLSDLDPQVKAALSAVADRLLERLNGWLHQEADQVTDSFNRWLHQEVDRLQESLRTWLTAQLSETDTQTVELEPVEG